VGAVLAEDRRQLGQRLQGRVAAWRLIDLDDGVALATLDGHRDDLLGQPAVVGGGDRALVGAQRPAVEVGPGQLQLGGDLGRLLGHVLAAEGARQPVAEHRVKRLGVAHAKAEAGVLEQVRRLGHRLHPAADGDVEVPGANGGVDHPGGAHARRAHLVDRLGGDLLGDAGADLRLAGGDLADAGLQNLTHDDVLDVTGLDVGALQRTGDGGRSELGCLQRGQTPAELADRGPRGREDDGLGHVGLSPWMAYLRGQRMVMAPARRGVSRTVGVSKVTVRARRREPRRTDRDRRRRARPRGLLR
jgi:hypothetical protein